MYLLLKKKKWHYLVSCDCGFSGKLINRERLPEVYCPLCNKTQENDLYPPSELKENFFFTEDIPF
jgi:hypothetical protein